MKALEISLIKENSQSFTFYHERNPFSRWHYHPEYELVLIAKGTGKRMVGDSMDRFDAGDLVLLGSNLPHEWLCDDPYFSHTEGFQGEGIVIQFLENFLGDHFFRLPENRRLRLLFDKSGQGCLLTGQTKVAITDIMIRMVQQEATDRFYSLMHIFLILSATNEYGLLASPAFTSSFIADTNRAMKTAIEYSMQNFHRKIPLQKVLDLTNMSSTTFSLLFKKTYNMTFTEYVLGLRLGYACSLLTENIRSISQISLDAGFENLSNFNRLFKKAKSCTPKEYRKKSTLSERFNEYYKWGS